MSWEEVDAGWGRRAPYWAYLLEKQYWQAYDEVLGRLEVGPGVNYLDVACGSGLAASMAAHVAPRFPASTLPSGSWR